MSFGGSGECIVGGSEVGVDGIAEGGVGLVGVVGTETDIAVGSVAAALNQQNLVIDDLSGGLGQRLVQNFKTKPLRHIVIEFSYIGTVSAVPIKPLDALVALVRFIIAELAVVNAAILAGFGSDVEVCTVLALEASVVIELVPKQTLVAVDYADVVFIELVVAH